MNFVCDACRKEYKRRDNYNKHLISCKKIRNKEEINLNDISKNELYEMLKDLYKKYEKLENGYNEIKKVLNLKISIKSNIEILNEKYINNDNDFEDLIINIEIKEDDLNNIFENDYVIGIVKIIENNLNKLTIKPIKAFKSEENKIFIYLLNKSILKNEELKDNYSDKKDIWIEIIPLYLNKLINNIEKEIIKLFMKWKNENEKKYSEYTFSNIFNNYMKKVNGLNFKKTDPLFLINKKLYELIKE